MAKWLRVVAGIWVILVGLAVVGWNRLEAGNPAFVAGQIFWKILISGLVLWLGIWLIRGAFRQSTKRDEEIDE
jgi:hypothetical protein